MDASAQEIALARLHAQRRQLRQELTAVDHEIELERFRIMRAATPACRVDAGPAAGGLMRDAALSQAEPSQLASPNSGVGQAACQSERRCRRPAPFGLGTV